MRQGCNIRGVEAIGRFYSKREGVWLLDDHPRLPELVEHCCDVLRVAVCYVETPAGDSRRDCESRRFDPVGYDGVFGPAKLFDSFNNDLAPSGALDAGAHLV